ncbi:hypothetical protein D9619_002209 [Psilocybe cf. subviscida]|uniref:Uncharacterized protein n=1 Tax=Psilocybe cf. subviscida TaxID=2480587 RepID=A0A8H5F337_9AGAR|nr:hypothetical protein D9619_002209 [Psilocybe cf. subviscida]
MDSFFTLFALTASATVAAPASAPTEASATTQPDFPFEIVDEETAGKSGNSIKRSISTPVDISHPPFLSPNHPHLTYTHPTRD